VVGWSGSDNLPAITEGGVHFFDFASSSASTNATLCFDFHSSHGCSSAVGGAGVAAQDFVTVTPALRSFVSALPGWATPLYYLSNYKYVEF
jgi:hypothetical protein